MDCRNCLQPLNVQNVKVNDVIANAVDLIIECECCGHRINTFAREGDFIDLDELLAPATWVRNDDATFNSLLLVSGHYVPREAISTWTDDECRQAEEWALTLHVHASDNDDVEVPPMPACVAAYPDESSISI